MGVALSASLSARSFPFTQACPGQYTHRGFRRWMSTVHVLIVISCNITIYLLNTCIDRRCFIIQCIFFLHVLIDLLIIIRRRGRKRRMYCFMCLIIIRRRGRKRRMYSFTCFFLKFVHISQTSAPGHDSKGKTFQNFNSVKTWTCFVFVLWTRGLLYPVAKKGTIKLTRSPKNEPLPKPTICALKQQPILPNNSNTNNTHPPPTHAHIFTQSCQYAVSRTA